MRYAKGSVILDRPTRSVATIRHVTRVPKRSDLLGDPLPSIRRYLIVFDDGRYAMREGEGDFDDVDAGAAA